MAKPTSAVRPAVSGRDFGTLLRDWLIRNRYYFLAFFIPVVLMYISYAIFGLSPFGEKSVLALDLKAQYIY